MSRPAARQPAPIKGDMVVCPDGTLGLVLSLLNFPTGIHANVTFGSGGPVLRYALKSLRKATLAEIKAAGLDGVGCNQAAYL